jgi:dihydrofolate reductase
VRVGSTNPDDQEVSFMPTTRKLIGSTFVSLDGVIGDPQVWGRPYWDDEHNGYVHDLIVASDAMLLGRKTYEGFKDAWPERGGDLADRMNSMPKHVASRTLTETTWNASVIEGDVTEAVANLKSRPGANILKFGTGELDRTLIEHGLLDELHVWVFPVIVGSGERLMEGAGITHLDLLRTHTMASGIVVHVLGPKPT